MEVLFCEHVNDLPQSLFHLDCLITTASEFRELAKVTGSKVRIIGRVANCLDAHLGQIVCDKHGVVDWCISPGGNATDPICRVLASSDGILSWIPLKPQHSNPNPLANQVSSHTSRHPSQTPCLPWISYANQNLMLDSCKMVKSSLKHSICFCGIFSSWKQNFIAYRSSKVSSHPDYIFEIHQLWQSWFSRVYSNCCCCCSFEPEIIKIDQSSQKIYSNNIQNF